MMHRNMGQRSLAEAWLPERLGNNRRLEGVSEVVDWTCFERLLADIHSARTGRPSYPPLLMCKVLFTHPDPPLATHDLRLQAGDTGSKECNSDAPCLTRGIEDCR